jgi:MraZ protein
VQLAGLHMVALDAKGRLAIPSRYRELITQRSQGKMVITMQHHGQSLMLYPEVDFEEVARNVSKLSDFNPIEANMKYLIIGHASYLEVDSNGRVLVPQLLRELVGIDKKVALVGQANKLELWNEEAWLAKQKTLYTTGYADGVSERLKGFSL